MEKLKNWIITWAITAKTFFRHPIVTTKQFFKDFAEADIKGKVKKLVMAALFFFICYQVFVIACGLLLVFAILGMLFDSTTRRDTWRERHGREPLTKEEDWDARGDGTLDI